MGDIGWDRTVFAMIYPDAVARHLGIRVLDRIEAAGFEPVAWRVLWHRPADLDRFHERNISQVWQAYLYRLIDQVFAFGPTVALLMADCRPVAAQTCHQRLRIAKGPSAPSDSDAGTIRGDLGSVNRVLSLMHSSDSAPDSAAQSAVFAGADGFGHGTDRDQLRTMLTMLQASRPREERGYLGVLAGLRARLLAVAWDDLGESGRGEASAILDAGPMALVMSDSGERLAAYLPDAHPLAGLLRADFTPGAPGPDPHQARLTLAPFGIGLDEWECLVLATSRRCSPRRSHPHDFC